MLRPEVLEQEIAELLRARNTARDTTEDQHAQAQASGMPSPASVFSAKIHW